MNMNLRWTKKVTALAALFTFSLNTLTGYSMGVSLSQEAGGMSSLARTESLALDLASVRSIPEQVASIGEIFAAPSAQATIYHVQDAHSSQEAQQNIKKMLEYLTADSKIDTIFLEGVMEEVLGDWLRLFQDEEVNQKAAALMVRESLIGGAELFLLGHDHQNKKLRILGVEDPEIYRSNLEAYRAVLNHKAESENFLQALQTQILTQGSKILNKKLALFFKEWVLQTETLEDPFRHFKTLEKAAQETLGINWANPRSQIAWPQFYRLLKLTELEKSADLVKAKKEQEILAKWLVEKKVSEAIRRPVDQMAEVLGSGKWSSESPRKDLEALEEILRPLGFEFKDYPALSNVLGRILLRSEIDAQILMRESTTMRDQILEKMAVSDNEKKVIQVYKDYLLLKSLLVLELSSEDYAEVKKGQAHMLPVPLAAQLAAFESKEGAMQIKGTAAMQELAAQALTFYQLARKRDQVISETMLKKMKALGKRHAVLITGGFHAEGMHKLWEKGGISFVELTPHLSEIKKDTNYEKVMLLKADYKTRLATLKSLSAGQPDLVRFMPVDAARLDAGLDAVQKAVVALEMKTNSPKRWTSQVARYQVRESPRAIAKAKRSEVRQLTPADADFIFSLGNPLDEPFQHIARVIAGRPGVPRRRGFQAGVAAQVEREEARVVLAPVTLLNIGLDHVQAGFFNGGGAAYREEWQNQPVSSEEIRLAYDVSTPGSFQGAAINFRSLPAGSKDFSATGMFVFQMRADVPCSGNCIQMEFKDMTGRVASVLISGVTTDWQEVQIPRAKLNESNPDVDYAHLKEITFVAANRAGPLGIQNKTGALGIRTSGLAFDPRVSSIPTLGHNNVTPVPLTQAGLQPTFNPLFSREILPADGGTTLVPDLTTTSAVTMLSPTESIVSMNLSTNRSFAGAFFTPDVFDTATVVETLNLDTAFPAGIVLGVSDQTPGAGRVKLGVTDINGRNDEVYLQVGADMRYFQISTAQFDEVDRTQIKAIAVVVDQAVGVKTLRVDWGAFDFVPEILPGDPSAAITGLPLTSQNERPVLTAVASQITPEGGADTSHVSVQQISPQTAQLVFDTKFETSFGGAFLNYDYYLTTAVHENIDLTAVFPAGITLGLSRSVGGPETVHFEVTDINGNKAKVAIKNIGLTEGRWTIPLSQLAVNNSRVDRHQIQSISITAEGLQNGTLTVHWGDFSFAQGILPGDPSMPVTSLPLTSLGERPDLTPFKSEQTPENTNDPSRVTLVQSSPENTAINFNLALESSYGGVFINYDFYRTSDVENINLLSVFPNGITLGLSRSADGPVQINLEVTDINGNKALVTLQNIGLTEGRWTAPHSDFTVNNPAIDLTHIKAIALVSAGVQQGTLNLHWGAFKQANAIAPDAFTQPVTIVPPFGPNRPDLTGFSSETNPDDGSTDSSTVVPQMLSRFDFTIAFDLQLSSSYGGVFFSYDNSETPALETIDFNAAFPSGLTLHADNGGSALSQIAFEITTVDASLPEGTRHDRVILSGIDASTHSWTIHASDFHEGDPSKIVSIALVASGIHENQTLNVQWGEFTYVPVIVVSPSFISVPLPDGSTYQFNNSLSTSAVVSRASVTKLSANSATLKVVSSQQAPVYMAFQSEVLAALHAMPYDLPGAPVPLAGQTVRLDTRAQLAAKLNELGLNTAQFRLQQLVGNVTPAYYQLTRSQDGNSIAIGARFPSRNVMKITVLWNSQDLQAQPRRLSVTQGISLSFDPSGKLLVALPGRPSPSFAPLSGQAFPASQKITLPGGRFYVTETSGVISVVQTQGAKIIYKSATAGNLEGATLDAAHSLLTVSTSLGGTIRIKLATPKAPSAVRQAVSPVPVPAVPSVAVSSDPAYTFELVRDVNLPHNFGLYLTQVSTGRRIEIGSGSETSRNPAVYGIFDGTLVIGYHNYGSPHGGVIEIMRNVASRFSLPPALAKETIPGRLEGMTFDALAHTLHLRLDTGAIVNISTNVTRSEMRLALPEAMLNVSRYVAGNTVSEVLERSDPVLFARLVDAVAREAMGEVEDSDLLLQILDLMRKHSEGILPEPAEGSEHHAHLFLNEVNASIINEDSALGLLFLTLASRLEQSGFHQINERQMNEIVLYVRGGSKETRAKIKLIARTFGEIVLKLGLPDLANKLVLVDASAWTDKKVVTDMFKRQSSGYGEKLEKAILSTRPEFLAAMAAAKGTLRIDIAGVKHNSALLGSETLLGAGEISQRSLVVILRNELKRMGISNLLAVRMAQLLADVKIAISA